MLTVSDPQNEALENLRVIRSLMERASVYRALSAPAALFGGVLAVIAGIHGFIQHHNVPGSESGVKGFLVTWLGILFVASLLNLALLMRDARRRGQPLITDGLRMAMRGLVPPMLSGGVLGISLILRDQQMLPAALIWINCYGLALQATVGFAPRSIIRLARAFLVAGQALAIAWALSGGFAGCQNQVAMAFLVMGLTFGVFHIVFAIGAFKNKPQMLTMRHV